MIFFKVQNVVYFFVLLTKNSTNHHNFLGFWSYTFIFGDNRLNLVLEKYNFWSKIIFSTKKSTDFNIWQILSSPPGLMYGFVWIFCGHFLEALFPRFWSASVTLKHSKSMDFIKNNDLSNQLQEGQRNKQCWVLEFFEKHHIASHKRLCNYVIFTKTLILVIFGDPLLRRWPELCTGLFRV